MAYVLGYIAADGTITIGKRGNYYLEIQSIDVELLQMVKRALAAEHTITSRRRNPHHHVVYRLQIGSKIIVQDLIAIGMAPNKTRRLPFPHVPDQFLRDFIRGYFDGDGNIFSAIYNRTDRRHGKIHYLRVLFTSCSKVFLIALKNFLTKQADMSPGKLKSTGNYFRLHYYRKIDVIKFYHFLYNHHPTLYLSRKFVYFKKALQTRGR